MRSPIGSILVILGLATTLILVLVLFQTIGLRGDLEKSQADVARVRAQVAELTATEPGVGGDELQRQLDVLETDLRALITANGGSSPGAPGTGGQGNSDEVLQRLNDVLDRLEGLDARLDQICESVPIC